MSLRGGDERTATVAPSSGESGTREVSVDVEVPERTTSGRLRPPRAATAGRLLFGWLALVLLVVFVMDVLDLGGSWLARSGAPPAWFLLFAEGAPVEWGQTLAGLGFLVTGGWIVATADGDRDDTVRGLVLWLVAGMAVLLLEDTNNVGQRIQDLVLELFGDGLLHDLVRLPIFALAGGLITWGLFRHRAALARHPRAGRLLLAGYGVYAFMGISGELLESLFDVYYGMGDVIGNVLLRGTVAPPPGSPPLWNASWEYVFMDFVYEETLELVAITLLLMGLLELAATRRRS